MLEIKDTYYDSVAIDVTYQCNFRCKHCFNFSGEQCISACELSDEELLKLCEQVSEVKPNTICLCGGEPLLRKDIVFKMVKTLKSGGVKNVNIVSNGYIIDNEIAHEIKKSGIDMVQISLDGAKAESHDWMRNKDGAYIHAINAIKNLRHAGLEVSVAYCPTSRTVNEIDDLLKLCNELGVFLFRSQPLMNIGRAGSIQEYMLNEIESFKLSAKMASVYNGKIYKNMKIEWGDPLEHLYTMSKGIELRFLTINAYGDILISPYLPIKIGNLRKHSLREYLGSGLLNIVKNKEIQNICKLYRSTQLMNQSKNNMRFPELYKDELIDLDVIEFSQEENSEKIRNIIGG